MPRHTRSCTSLLIKAFAMLTCFNLLATLRAAHAQQLYDIGGGVSIGFGVTPAEMIDTTTATLTYSIPAEATQEIITGVRKLFEAQEFSFLNEARANQQISPELLSEFSRQLSESQPYTYLTPHQQLAIALNDEVSPLLNVAMHLLRFHKDKFSRAELKAAWTKIHDHEKNFEKQQYSTPRPGRRS